MKLKVKLSRLNRVPVGIYNYDFPIYLGDSTTPIGTGTLYQETDNSYSANLSFSATGVDENVYYYYRHRHDESGHEWFCALELYFKPEFDKSPNQLKDIIIP